MTKAARRGEWWGEPARVYVVCILAKIVPGYLPSRSLDDLKLKEFPESILDIRFRDKQHNFIAMRLLRSLALCALTVAFVAAKPPQPSAFDKYAALQGSSPTIELDAKAYDELTTPPRDYSVAILLTAIDPRYMCKLCQDFQEEWEIIGRSWQKGGESRVLFGTIDFDKEKSIFQRV